MRSSGSSTRSRFPSDSVGFGARFQKILHPGILVRVTNLGLGFILLTLVVAIAATNTGNNGLYILVSLFLGALVVSGVVSRRNVENVEAELDGPAEVFAGVPVRFTLRLTNAGRLARRGLLVKISSAAAPILFGRLEPGRPAERGVDLVFPRRGKRSIESLLLYSGYPIGLFRKGRVHPLADERLVFPSPVPMPRIPPDPRESEGGDARDRRKGRGADIRNLRDAGFGDDPRDVHWPQTARQGKFIVKERASEEGRDALVALDTRRPAGSTADWDERFERAVSEAAGMALQLLARGSRVGLLLGGIVVPPGSGPAHRRSLLRALALVEAAENARETAAFPAALAIYRVGVGSGRAA
jgi:uncharacterized protein (DUF58 family)